MVQNFDVLEYCRKLRTLKQPPYTCPVPECSKTYKSMCGLQYHLVNVKHDNLDAKHKIQIPGPSSDVANDEKKVVPSNKEKSEVKTSSYEIKTEPIKTEGKKEFTFPESQRLVEIEIDDHIHKLDIHEAIPIISQHNYELLHSNRSSACRSNSDKTKNKELACKLPEPRFKILDDYTIPNAPPKPTGYIRFIEKSVEDMDGEVEYDLDEEDAAWLEITNKNRKEQGLDEVTVENFELLMDRLEKESYFQMETNNKDQGAVIDDDAICCICMDGDCQNTNVILFCDMCNLAVHQDCYGVPYIPEGQWLCRRCLHSPSRAVDCVLCPNLGGAFKQTDRGHWAHVVCALWIPEVRFANAVFLEPIDSIETIPNARWRLVCYLCKQKGVGACIQCRKTNCYSAFHVTCGQHAGLYMQMQTVGRSEAEGEIVEKVAYCENHTPEDAEERPKLPRVPGSPQARSQNLAHTISIPTIPPDKIQEIGALAKVSKSNQFIRRLIAYWTLKRQLRNGVPLLRSLQATHINRRESSYKQGQGPKDGKQLEEQLKYWYRFRQDLEKARLLCELVRKRERLKRELIRVKGQCLEIQLCPLVSLLRRLVDSLRSYDTGEIFIEPVDQSEVPNYSSIVKSPMDLSTMRRKVDEFQYKSLSEFEEDFELMISNCLAFNSKDSVFFKAALKMKQQGAVLLKKAAEELAGLSTDSLREINSNLFG